MSSSLMKIIKSPRFSYLVASSLLLAGAGVLGYAPVRALLARAATAGLAGAGTVTALVAASAAEAAAPADPPQPVAAPADPNSVRGPAPDLGLPVEQAVLAAPPHVPPPITRKY
ncbi:MAG: hypothetical protein WC485_09960, partial [Opitutaceae bacterium]